MQKQQPLTVGLTGVMGCGKTLISKIFAHFGVPVYYSDDNAKKLYKNKEVILQIQTLFGDDVITNGQLDKKKLADIVFNDSNALQRLNNYIHPLVKLDFENWAKYQNCPYIIIESAIIHEIGWQHLLDKVICVFSPIDLILQRVKQRDNQTEEEIVKRINSQMPQKLKIEKSDYTIINDNCRLVIPQAREIHQNLLDIANNR